MNATTTYEQADFRCPADVYPKEAGKRGAWESFITWLGRVGERSSMGRRAETFARLNALGDDELAAMGLHRDELMVRCFGGRALL